VNEKHKARADKQDITAFDAASVAELVNSAYWSDAMDAVLVEFLTTVKGFESVWEVNVEAVDEGFRGLQQKLTKLCLVDERLSHRWGFRGPKRRAVLARMALLRSLNLLLAQYLDLLVSGEGDALETNAAQMNSRASSDNDPTMITVRGSCPENNVAASKSSNKYRTRSCLESRCCHWNCRAFLQPRACKDSYQISHATRSERHS
jgi:hypothetical protein